MRLMSKTPALPNRATARWLPWLTLLLMLLPALAFAAPGAPGTPLPDVNVGRIGGQPVSLPL